MITITISILKLWWEAQSSVSLETELNLWLKLEKNARINVFSNQNLKKNPGGFAPGPPSAFIFY